MDVVYYAAASLDGRIATEDGGVEWLDEYQKSGDDHGFGEFWKTIDVLLMGRRTYEFALAQPHWMAPDRPTRVFTRRELRVAHPTVTLTGADPTDVVNELREAGFRRAWLVGGGELAGSFLERDLITELIVTVVPILLGRGIPLFGTAAPGRRLTLVEMKELSQGLSQMTYRFEDPGGE